MLEGEFVSNIEKKVVDDSGVLLNELKTQIAENFRIRRDLPDGGRLYLERRLPFITVYRRPADRSDFGSDELVTSQAAYIIGDEGSRAKHRAGDVVREICRLIQPAFGAFLIVEIWTRPPEHPPLNTDTEVLAPGFRLFSEPMNGRAGSLLDVLTHHLGQISVGGVQATVEQVRKHKEFTGKPKPFLKAKEAGALRCVQLGIEVEPIFQQEGGAVFPNVLKRLRRNISYALQHCFFHFAEHQTMLQPKNFHSLGRRALVKSVWSADAKLHAIAAGFDFLREVNPVNIESVWREFKRSGYETMPPLRYLPLTIDPSLTKRVLFSIPLERIEDPTILYLFQQRQAELDRKLTMLSDRGTRRFVLGSRQLYGSLSPSLMRTAEAILEKIPASSREIPGGRSLSPQELAALAEKEIAYYRRKWPEFSAPVLIRPDVIAGLMVSNGRLLISDSARMPVLQAEALLQHEVGTHLVTYFNGKAQKLAQLSSGLADYEQLQEGLAVMAEYLVGGLTPGRMRTLAARVIGAKVLVDGGTFIDCFRLLSRFGFKRRAAFNITVRIYRGGGLTKDSVYLRGLSDVLKYLREGGELAPLFVGKIATKQIPVVTELMSRNVIAAPKLLPRYLERKACLQRLAELRGGVAVHDLLTIDTE